MLHELLGQPQVKNYDGSWTEYGSLVGVPIELGDGPVSEEPQGCGAPAGGVAITENASGEAIIEGARDRRRRRCRSGTPGC